MEQTIPRLQSGLIDVKSIEVEASDFTPSDAFMKQRKNGNLQDVFRGDVIEACFQGKIRNLDDGKDTTILLTGELYGCTFGLVVDLENNYVIIGWVLECNSVQAHTAGLWSPETVRRMSEHQHDHWSTEGNKSTWHGSEQEQKSYYDGEHTKFS